MSLIEQLQATEPSKGILFIAIQALQEPSEIYKFFDEYVLYMKTLGKSHLARQSPEEAARRNIGYTIPFCDKPIAEKWRELAE